MAGLSVYMTLTKQALKNCSNLMISQMPAVVFAMSPVVTLLLMHLTSLAKKLTAVLMR